MSDKFYKSKRFWIKAAFALSLIFNIAIIGFVAGNGYFFLNHKGFKMFHNEEIQEILQGHFSKMQNMRKDVIVLAQDFGRVLDEETVNQEEYQAIRARSVDLSAQFNEEFLGAIDEITQLPHQDRLEVVKFLENAEKWGRRGHRGRKSGHHD